jgi:hypothetical protein
MPQDPSSRAPYGGQKTSAKCGGNNKARTTPGLETNYERKLRMEIIAAMQLLCFLAYALGYFHGRASE